jgi:putative Mg2+ transporter-C (MgtC) family protein
VTINPPRRPVPHTDAVRRGEVGDLVAIARIALATALGLAIGLERLLRGNPAGPRTFALLGMGASAFAVVASGINNDGRLIAGIATGVGFIGAGMIFHDSGRGIVGFATAAASWATVAGGVLAGLGREVVAVAVAAMAILVLEVQYFGLTEWFARHKGWHRIERDSDPDLGRGRDQ